MTAINSNLLSGDAIPGVGTGNDSVIKPGVLAKAQGVKAQTLSFSAALEQHTSKRLADAANPRRELNSPRRELSPKSNNRSEQSEGAKRRHECQQKQDNLNPASPAEKALTAEKNDIAHDRDEDEDDVQASSKSNESDRLNQRADAAATSQEQRDADDDAHQESADLVEAPTVAGQHDQACLEKSSPCDSDELPVAQNVAATGNTLANQTGNSAQPDTQSNSATVSNAEVTVQAAPKPLDSAKPVAQNELGDSAKQQVAATSLAVGESKTAKSVDTSQKLDINPINDAANSKRALTIDSQQQQQSNSNTQHLLRDPQSPSHQLPQRSMADNFLQAMQTALRVQNANGNSAPLSGGDSATPVLESVNSNAASASSETAATAISPLKTETSTAAANPLQKLFAPINERVGQGQWQQEMSQRINMMLNHQIQNAQIQLHPKHLGAMEISVSMGHDQQVNVSFQVQHAHVKDALDAALPKLRDMLQSQGFSLNHSDISQRQHSNDGQESHHARSAYSARSFGGETEISDTNSVQHLSIQPTPSGGLDLFV